MNCHTTYQLDKYQGEYDASEAFNDAINARISKLMDDEFNPKEPGNIFDCIGALNDDQREIFVAMVNHSTCTLAVMIRTWVNGYMELCAEKQSIKELSP